MPFYNSYDTWVFNQFKSAINSCSCLHLNILVDCDTQAVQCNASDLKESAVRGETYTQPLQEPQEFQEEKFVSSTFFLLTHFITA